GLIPSLLWNFAAVPDMMHEPVSAWGDPASKTQDFMRSYTREMLRRYGSSPAIWIWEFGNEYNYQIDFPNAAAHRARIVPQLGTPTFRTAQDDLTLEMLSAAFEQFVKLVREQDTYRAVSSGNAVPRQVAYHNHAERNGRVDTRAEWNSMLLAQNAAF